MVTINRHFKFYLTRVDDVGWLIYYNVGKKLKWKVTTNNISRKHVIQHKYLFV